MLFVPWLRRTATLECYFCFFKAMVGFPGCSALSQQHNKEDKHITAPQRPCSSQKYCQWP